MEKWTASKIREIRKNKRGQNQTQFGLDIYDTDPKTAQKLVSDLERGKMNPGSAARKTIERMAKGKI